MKKIILIIALFVFNSALIFAQTQQQKVVTQKMQGKIILKSWSKSTESYCAGGSDYFVLAKGEEEIILENQSKQNLENFTNKTVWITGFLKKKTIKPSNNPNEQRPVNMNLDGEEENFTCEVFVIKKIKAI